MYIPIKYIDSAYYMCDPLAKVIRYYEIPIKGILHVGAAIGEERSFYTNILGVNDSDIVWVDAIRENIEFMKSQGVQHCYQAVIDSTERDTVFNITTFPNSSSLFDLGTHLEYHPDITVAEKRRVQTESLPTFFQKHSLTTTNYNIWVFDIQGGEYNAFKGAGSLLDDVDIILTEISVEEVYKGIGLLNDIDTLLSEHHFKRVDTHIGSNKYGDAIYINTKRYQS